MTFMRDGRARWSTGALVAVVALAAAVHFTVHAQPAPGAPATPAAPGKSIYDSKCAECHGPSGRGDGPAAMFLSPRPRDFTRGSYKLRSTDTGNLPTDDDLVAAVTHGLPGSSMPGWKGLLTESDITAVVAYVKAFSPRFASETPKAITVTAAVPASAESLTRGKATFEKLQCSGCHGTDGRGKDAIATDFEDDWGGPLVAADLTAPWTFHGGPTSRDIFMRLRTGMSGTPMPSFSEAAKDAELWDVANYVASLARKPVWSMTAEEVTAHYAAETAAAKADPVKRGHQLVDTLVCAQCHSPVDEHRRVLPGLKMAGGQVLRIAPYGDYPTANLTSDKETGLGNWTDAEIRTVLTKGIMRDGTRMLPFPMDWPAYALMAPEDIDAIIAYLRTIPPVPNRVPRPSRPALPAFLWGKFQMLMLGKDQPMAFFPGNAGSAKGGH